MPPERHFRVQLCTDAAEVLITSKHLFVWIFTASMWGLASCVLFKMNGSLVPDREDLMKGLF
ncbi:uncharacterized protein QC763_0079870 [Podospora pseudopauciseta]|uniref:Uncharacterized protein n=1 Tax=Podospora pseudopauciseta TaxID=2093780 RepID=A0ABR0H721_9PEZI|nr:hypothetical protein QC763_0079870 [Podospora pseudopauciseta]